MRIINNKYELLKEIGHGGMSTVYLAMDVKINKQWAIKEIHKDSEMYKATVDEGKVLAEVRLMKDLNHYGLPRIADMITTKNSIFIVMDYIEGENLRKLLSINGPFTQEDVIKYGLEVLDILEYLHGQNPPIVYRDLKPANLMLTPQGDIKIVDFGIARKYVKGFEDTRIMGTVGFVAPEQQSGKSDPRSDIFSFGVTLYQLLTNQNMEEETYIKSITDFDPSYSTGLEKVIEKCTKANPNERYQTVSELRYDLENYYKLDNEYIKIQKKKINRFLRTAIMGCICTILGISLIAGISIKKSNDYMTLVEAPAIDTSERVDNLTKAINIKPTKTTAYEELIKEYAKDGFNEEEAGEFIEIYNANKNALGNKETEISFTIGEAFLNYFEGDSDKSSRNTLAHAKPFFAAASKSEEQEIKLIAENYVFLAEYQESFIYGTAKLNIKEKEPSESRELLKKLENTLKSINGYNGKEDIKHLKLVTYESILDVLDNEINVFTTNGISLDEISSILNSIRDETQKMDVHLAVSEKKKEEVLSKINDFTKKYNANVSYKEKKEEK